MKDLHRYSILLAILLVLVLPSCDTLNPSEEIPAYIRIDSVSIVQDEDTGFQSSVGLKDVWLYHGNDLLGVFPVPCIIPYTDIASTSISVEGGVYETGQSQLRVPYPFWARESFVANQAAGDTFTINPVLHYKDPIELDVQIDETFESGINFEPFQHFADTAQLRRVTIDPFMGNFCGRVLFRSGDTSGHQYFQAINILPSPMTFTSNSDAYAEITYKSSLPLAVGLVYRNNNVDVRPIVTLSPKSEWTTVYVHLVQPIREIIAADPLTITWFNLWLYADGLDEDHELFLDNIRLINFP